MLRIISGFLLLIISQVSFASTSTTTETIAAIAATSNTNVNKWCAGGSNNSTCSDTPESSCVKAGTAANYYTSATQYMCKNGQYIYVTSIPITVTTYSCPSGYTLSGTNCTKENTVDSCTSYAGQSGYFWVSKKSAPSTVCSGTCLATISGTWGDSPDVDPAAYTQHQYTYTGATGECTSDSGFTDAATAAESNAAVAEKERLAKVQKAIDDAIIACGGVGFYTSGTFNGETVIACTNQDKKTETTTTTTTSGATTTTANTSTTTNNNGQTTTVKPDGTSTTVGGTTTSSGKTSTSTTSTNPDGSTTTTTTASGATGTCSESDMKGTVGCADMGEIPDTAEVPSDEEDSGLGSYTPWGSSSSACPAPSVVNGHIIDNSDQCSFFSKLKPFIIAAGFLIAVYISLGIRSSGGD